MHTHTVKVKEEDGRSSAHISTFCLKKLSYVMQVQTWCLQFKKFPLLESSVFFPYFACDVAFPIPFLAIGRN